MRKTQTSAVILFLTILSLTVQSQTNNSIMMSIAGENITKGEFLKVYEKNNTNNQQADIKSLEEYLDLFTNFRLKVAEAKDLGLDSLKSFREELAGYRKQLAAPYFTDNEVTNNLIQEAYNNKKFDVRTSHILIKVDRNASANDTLQAWNKAIKIRKRLLAGEDFGKLAKETSDDPSANDRTIQGQTIKGNKGDLGYFNVFDMVYPFEKAAYSLKINEISMPIRTDFGYHILKLTNKIPSVGKIQLAHIILVYKQGTSLDDSLRIADSAALAYKALKGGSDFADVAKKFSDDISTSSKGGVLPWFGVNKLLPEFVTRLQFLKIGQYSEPFQTHFGWHIIKLVDQKTLGSIEDEQDNIKKTIANNDRSEVVYNSFINKTKVKYGFSAP